MKQLSVSSILLVVTTTLVVSTFFVAAFNESPEVGSARGVQSKVDELQNELHQKMQQLEEEFAGKRLPIYRERNKLLSKITGFWKRALAHHPNFGQVGNGKDLEILEHLIDLDVADVPPPATAAAAAEQQEEQQQSHKYSVKLTFSPNTFFTDTKLWRTIDSYHNDLSTSTDVSGINWLPNQAPKTAASFFNFFEQPSSHHAGSIKLDSRRLLDVAHLLRYEIFTNPFTYYDIPNYAEIASEEARRQQEQLAAAQEGEGDLPFDESNVPPDHQEPSEEDLRAASEKSGQENH